MFKWQKHDFVQLTKSYCKQNKTFIGNTHTHEFSLHSVLLASINTLKIPEYLNILKTFIKHKGRHPYCDDGMSF